MECIAGRRPGRHLYRQDLLRAPARDAETVPSKAPSARRTTLKADVPDGNHNRRGTGRCPEETAGNPRTTRSAPIHGLPRCGRRPTPSRDDRRRGPRAVRRRRKTCSAGEGPPSPSPLLHRPNSRAAARLHRCALVRTQLEDLLLKLHAGHGLGTQARTGTGRPPTRLGRWQKSPPGPRRSAPPPPPREGALLWRTPTPHT